MYISSIALTYNHQTFLLEDNLLLKNKKLKAIRLALAVDSQYKSVKIRSINFLLKFFF